uniref:Ig-like domain-containing protein n=1 Tax=Salarias fasciatus TaxID=181472 RepID=A0A672F810_SALFA
CWSGWILLLSLILRSGENISAVEGQTVSLPCEAPNQETIRVVEWTRPDLGENPDVLSYKYGHFDRDNHRSYKNRVDLKNVKDGDVSLIMKNVAFRDSGTYKCFIAQGGESNNIKLISSISLSVVSEKFPQGELACGGQAFIATSLFDPSMSALPLIYLLHNDKNSRHRRIKKQCCYERLAKDRYCCFDVLFHFYTLM